MTGQAKTCHIGQGMHARVFGQGNAWAVELCGQADHVLVARNAQRFFFERGRQNAHAQRLAQHQHIAHLGAVVALDLGGVNQAHHHQAVNRLHRVNGVSASNRNACGVTHILAALQDAPDGVNRQHVDRHAHQAQRHDGGAAHGIHIADGIGRGNAAKVIRVVHDGHEEVCGGNQRLLVVELVHRRIVGSFNADQELRWHHKPGAVLHALQDVAQHSGRNLAATAAAVGQ